MRKDRDATVHARDRGLFFKIEENRQDSKLDTCKGKDETTRYSGLIMIIKKFYYLSSNPWILNSVLNSYTKKNNDQNFRYEVKIHTQ